MNGKSVDVLEIDESIQDVKIADLSTVDPDVGQTFTYIIKSGDEGIFEIVGNQLKVYMSFFIPLTNEILR